MNNNYNFDPMTGQPVQQPVQNQNATNMYSQPQQPVQPTMNTYQQPSPQQPNKKNNTKLLIIIALVIVIGIVVGVLLLTNQKDKEAINSDNNNNSEVENNNETTEDKNTSGIVEEGVNTTYDENGAFLFRIEDVFTITGRGTVVTGTVERGTINLNDEVQVIGLDKEIITTTVTGVEVFRKNQDFATVGDNPGLLLKGVERDQVERGQAVVMPNSITAVKKFQADLSVIPTEEGGRGTPFYDGFSPKIYFKTDISGTINLPNGKEKVEPGENASVTITLEQSIAMDVGTEFSIREGGRTIANGKVTKVY